MYANSKLKLKDNPSFVLSALRRNKEIELSKAEQKYRAEVKAINQQFDKDIERVQELLSRGFDDPKVTANPKNNINALRCAEPEKSKPSDSNQSIDEKKKCKECLEELRACKECKKDLECWECGYGNDYQFQCKEGNCYVSVDLCSKCKYDFMCGDCLEIFCEGCYELHVLTAGYHPT